MPDHLGDDMRKVKDDKEEPEKEIKCEYFVFYLFLNLPYVLRLNKCIIV